MMYYLLGTLDDYLGLLGFPRDYVSNLKNKNNVPTYEKKSGKIFITAQLIIKYNIC